MPEYLIAENHLHIGKFLDRLEKPLLPLTGACRTLPETEEQNRAFASQKPSHLFTGHFSTKEVVGRYRADEVFDGCTAERRIHDHHRDSFLHGSGHRALQRRVVNGRQHDAAHILGNELLHDLDLLCGVLLLEGALPDHLHTCFLRAFPCSGFDRFPENVRCILRYYSN